MNQPLTLASLLPGDEVEIAGTKMMLYYWSGNSPCFIYFIDHVAYYFIERCWTERTLLKHVK